MFKVAVQTITIVLMLSVFVVSNSYGDYKLQQVEDLQLKKAVFEARSSTLGNLIQELQDFGTKLQDDPRSYVKQQKKFYFTDMAKMTFSHGQTELNKVFTSHRLAYRDLMVLTSHTKKHFLDSAASEIEILVNQFKSMKEAADSYVRSLNDDLERYASRDQKSDVLKPDVAKTDVVETDIVREEQCSIDSTPVVTIEGLLGQIPHPVSRPIEFMMESNPQIEVAQKEEAQIEESVKSTEAPVSTYTVKKGDSLWKIASKLSKKTDASIDELVKKIAEINHLGSGNVIYPGQTLTVPMGNDMDDYAASSTTEYSSEVTKALKDELHDAYEAFFDIGAEFAQSLDKDETSQNVVLEKLRSTAAMYNDWARLRYVALKSQIRAMPKGSERDEAKSYLKRLSKVSECANNLRYSNFSSWRFDYCLYRVRDLLGAAAV